ncbi:uncharacterized protein LOC118180736 [Stegodyphus dumicola]|uniref:uncharacterized protein LOC118180736 n=1 Tax=Stegodyphus dumicola TaxID=202533 RepID=UPI0015B0934F|nr:uncharacterized protein LOC118180736 [Stegodyphus dumicola]
MQKLSPFVISKHIQSSIGEPRNIKRLRSGDLLIDTATAIQSASLLRLTKLGEVNVTVSEHKTLNYCRGVISEFDLLSVSEEELVSELANQKVCAARRIKMRKEGQLIDTKHVILTFKSPDLPKNIKAGYLNCPVRPYIPNPMRCFQCQRFGHTKISCRGKLTCARCSVAGHNSDACTAAPLCINCKGEHAAFSRSCPKWKAEREIQAVKHKRNISYAEARRIVEGTQPRTGMSFASAAKSKRSVGTQTSVSTQRPAPKIQPAISKPKIDKPTLEMQKTETVSPNKLKNLTQEAAKKETSASNSSFDEMISDSFDSDNMEVEPGLEIPKHLLPRKTKTQHRKTKHHS